MATAGGEPIELQDAANRLGVHYQTAYRWVRSGRLEATLVDGRYLITADAIDSVERSRRRPAAPTRPSPARLERRAQRVHDALIEGDEATVREVARGLVAEGTPLLDLMQTVFAPPLQWIGQAWSDGQLTIWVEHRASAIVERTLGELSPNPRGRRRGVVLVAALAGDRHTLPTTMATVALRDANWHVHHLGADMPADELVRFTEEHEVDVAVISLTNPDVADLAAATAERLRSSGTAVIIGGPGRSLDDLLAAAKAARSDLRAARRPS